jgi:octaprenyl-diphosphate synthase
VEGEVIQLRGRLGIGAQDASPAVRSAALESIYFRIVEDKTASLFVWAARAGASIAGAPPAAVQALGAFGGHLGVAFQLVDDVLDYDADPSVTGKALLVDLREGKMTLPLIRALLACPALAADLDEARGGDTRAAVRVAQVVRDSGACVGVRMLAREETARALAALDSVPAGAPRELLAGIARDLALRAS